MSSQRKVSENLAAFVNHVIHRPDIPEILVKVKQYSWPVHRVDLTRCSGIFDTTCSPSLKGANSSILNLTNDNPMTVARMVQFIYCGDFETVFEPAIGSIRKLEFSLSEMFSRFKSVSDYNEIIMDDLNAGPAAAVCRVYEFAKKYNIMQLKAKALEHIENDKIWSEFSDFGKVRNALMATAWSKNPELRRKIGRGVGSNLQIFWDDSKFQQCYALIENRESYVSLVSAMLRAYKESSEKKIKALEERLSESEERIQKLRNELDDEEGGRTRSGKRQKAR